MAVIHIDQKEIIHQSPSPKLVGVNGQVSVGREHAGRLVHLIVVEAPVCWNCEEDHVIGADGLCSYCRAIYKEGGTKFDLCKSCGKLIEYGGKHKTKHGMECGCEVK